MPAPSIRSLSLGLFVFFLILSLFVGCAHPPTSTNPATVSPNPATRAHLVESCGKLPFSFEANQGQTDSEVKFLARGPEYGSFIISDESHCFNAFIQISVRPIKIQRFPYQTVTYKSSSA
jgi:hypothetical protein